jgi:hypothetical protein
MVHVCPRCQRVNPQEAAFCYFDGAVLRPGGPNQGAATQQLPREFRFPSGRGCRTFDALAEGCHQEWDNARLLLERGDFARYLGLIGRLDLARAAQEAVHSANGNEDLALHNFLDVLPIGQVTGPKLDLRPRRLIIGPLRPGEKQPVELVVSNRGQGQLQGKVTVQEGSDWLKVIDPSSATPNSADIRTARELTIHLRAAPPPGMTAPQSYSARLTVITNGGVSEVPAVLDLLSIPFAGAPFQGAATPRELAERMRLAPKQAVPLLESGEISRWFQGNGWAYPVSGVPARGVAAVQQFFEGMGLSKPPEVRLSEDKLEYTCVTPEVVAGEVTLETTSRKWVFAQVDSDVPWLRVRSANVSGPQNARITFEIDSTLAGADQGAHEGKLTIVANAGQRLSLQVRANVRRPHEPFTRRLFRPFFVGALLAGVLRLLLVIPGDLYARLLQADASWPVKPGTLAGWIWAPTDSAEVAHFLMHFVLITWWLGIPLGVILVWNRGGISDRFFAAIAGATFGLFAAATLGGVLLIGDSLPRGILSLFAGLGQVTTSPYVWTPLWILLATLCWTIVGGGLGLLLCGMGRPGCRLLTWLATPCRWVCQRCGLDRAANVLVLES